MGIKVKCLCQPNLFQMSKSEGYYTRGRSVAREEKKKQTDMPESIPTEISSGFGTGFKGHRIRCVGEYDNRNFRKGKLVTHQ